MNKSLNYIYSLVALSVEPAKLNDYDVTHKQTESETISEKNSLEVKLK